MKKTGTKNMIRTGARSIADVAAEMLWPTRCAVCDEPGDILCDDCRARLPYIDTTRACPRCGAPFGRYQCCECNSMNRKGDFPFDGMASALVLNEHTGRIITTFKDEGELRLAEIMAHIMAQYIPPIWITPPKKIHTQEDYLRSENQCNSGIDTPPTVTFIPASKQAIKRRGYDHAELLACALAQKLNLTMLPLLTRPHTLDQRKLSREARIANMEGSFSIIPEQLTSAKDASDLPINSESDPLPAIPRTVIIIDDVTTTGATLYSAAHTLKNPGNNTANNTGVKTLYALTFARTCT